jgi:hypothetical protein
MNDDKTQITVDQQKLETTEQIRDLFAKAHDYLAQATFPGHMGAKVAEVLGFLAFQYNDFKQRAERLKPPVVPSVVDVLEAKQAVEATLADKASQVTTGDEYGSTEAPRA